MLQFFTNLNASMHTEFWVMPLLTVHLNAWKLVGFFGTFLFSARWAVQVHARRKGYLHLPPTFWYMSVAGSGLLLLYFIFGKQDSVGVLSNAFPAFVAFYNLFHLPITQPANSSPPTQT